MLEDDKLILKTLGLVRLFTGFTVGNARDFLKWSERRDVAAGEVIVREGDPGLDLYIVAAGTLRVVKCKDGVEEDLATLEPGDSFGEISLLDRGVRSASVIALTPALLLRFERKHLPKIPDASMKLYRNIATVVASRLRLTSTHVILVKAAQLAAESAVSGQSMLPVIARKNGPQVLRRG